MQFCAYVKKMFEGGLYDTKYIAGAYPATKFHLSNTGSTLESLLVHFSEMAKTTDLLVEVEAKEKHGGFHSAGYDAMCTAKIFIMEMNILLQAKPPNAVSLPKEWRTHPTIASLEGKIAVHNVAPGHLDINEFGHTQEYAKILNRHFASPILERNRVITLNSTPPQPTKTSEVMFFRKTTSEPKIQPQVHVIVEDELCSWDPTGDIHLQTGVGVTMAPPSLPKRPSPSPKRSWSSSDGDASSSDEPKVVAKKKQHIET
eukprot:Platyproteum_vivax@DN486_c0_g1_i2.p1